MRTTISIADELLVALKERARATGRTLGQVIEAAVRRELSESAPDDRRPEVPVFRGGTGPLPGVELNSNRALAEILDRDRDLNSLR